MRKQTHYEIKLPTQYVGHSQSTSLWRGYQVYLCLEIVPQTEERKLAPTLPAGILLRLQDKSVWAAKSISINNIS